MAAKAAIGATCRAMSISTRPTSPTGSTPCLHLGEFHDDRPAEHDRSRVGRARHAGADDDGRGTRGGRACAGGARRRSEEHTSELQSLMRISYAVFCCKKKKITKI